ncbi:aminotransferase class I/II-fold pyridoxal phosphate-dependent enzyme, partial [Bordetella bronchiseptica]
MSKLDSLFTAALEQAAQRQVRRRLRRATAAPPGRLALDGRTLVNFSSNDYLGLARHPLLAERASLWATRHGAGAQASRLVCGNLDLHEQVEAKLARLKGTEAALLLASGWQANAAVLPALFKAAAAQGEPQVYTDRLNHASLHHGCQAAGVRQIRFRHNDLAHLEHLLAERAGAPGARFIVTESVFSMDGDRADVPALAALAARHHAFLYLDEAHATGVLGPRGMGLAGLAPGGVDLAMGTFSKGLGSFGAYVAGSRALCDYLVNACSGFIYTTALPPAVLGAIDAALDLVPRLDQARAALLGHGERLRASLAAQGIDCGASSTQIVPAIVGDAGHALALAAELERRGLLAVAIRPPTVPAGTSRLRIAL